MILIWTGWGVILIFIPILLMLFSYLLGLNTDNDFILGIVLLISGALMWFLGKRINIGEEKTYIDVETQEQIQVSTKNRHTLFFIPIHYWGILVALFGIVGAIFF